MARGKDVQLLAAAALLACGSVCAAPAAVPLVKPERPGFGPGAAFGFKKEKTRRSVSGIACLPVGAQRRCLVVFDEGVKAQFATLGAASLEPTDEPFELIASGKELDAEGAATDGNYFYAIGSHAVKRKDCESNPASRHLVRFKARWTASAGAPRLTIETMQDSQQLWDLMLKDPVLSRHADGCLGDGDGGRAEQRGRRPGLNIEGIAAQGGRLYVGLRAPVLGNEALVYSVDADALFAGGDPTPRLVQLPVGGPWGVRDLSAGRQAILMLLGPDDRQRSGPPQWRVAEWSPSAGGPGRSRPRVLAQLDLSRRNEAPMELRRAGGSSSGRRWPTAQGLRSGLSQVRFDTCAEDLKPEALTILAESVTAYRILVLSDGVCDGGPLVFDVPR